LVVTLTCTIVPSLTLTLMPFWGLTRVAPSAGVIVRWAAGSVGGGGARDAQTKRRRGDRQEAFDHFRGHSIDHVPSNATGVPEISGTVW
jgi:hypothetical protein